jgi:hypothetical protein
MVDAYYKDLSGVGYQVFDIPEGRCSTLYYWHYLREDLPDERVIPPGYPFEGTLVGRMQGYCGSNKMGQPFYYIWIHGDVIPISTMGLDYGACWSREQYEQFADPDPSVTIDAPAGTDPAYSQAAFLGIDDTTLLIAAAAGVAALYLWKKRK